MRDLAGVKRVRNMILEYFHDLTLPKPSETAHGLLHGAFRQGIVKEVGISVAGLKIEPSSINGVGADKDHGSVRGVVEFLNKPISFLVC
jgi:hypothetical protein